MEVSQKEQNRSKWRASTKHSRGRGRGGRGQGRGVSSHGALDLESNYDRYLGSDEEASSEADDGLPVRQSQGADLQQLLAESEQFYAQAHFRYRSFTEAVDTEPPPVDVAALEEELVIEPGPLIQALTQLPLNELLGLSVPLEFLSEEVSWDTAPKATLSSRTSSSTQQHQSTDTPAQTATYQQQQQQQPWQLKATAVTQQAPAGVAHTVASAQPATPATTAPAAATVASHAQPPNAPAAMASRAADDDTDELLELLLAGSPAPQQAAASAAPGGPTGLAAASSGYGTSTPAASVTSQQQAAAPAATPAVAAIGDSRYGAVEGQPASMTAQAAPQQPQAAGPAAKQVQPTKAAAFDDELDALLGLGPAGGAQAGQVQPQGAKAANGTATSSSKKQSLEEWLDGF